MNRGLKKAFLCAGIVFTVISIGITALIFAGYWLAAAADKPIKSDFIIVLAGEPSRAFYAADLFKQEFAGSVLVSRPVRVNSLKLLDEIGVDFPRAEDINKQVLIKKGVPADAVSFFGNSSISTVEEGESLRNMFFGRPGVKLLIVTSWYHARRVKLISRNFLRNAQITVVATPYERFCAKWWTDQDSARSVVLELIKTLFYSLGGAFHSYAAS